MTMKQTFKNNKQLEKAASIASVLILIVCWYLGGLQTNTSQTQLLHNVLSKQETIIQESPVLFKIAKHQNSQITTKKWLSLGYGVGYGGELQVAVELLPDGTLNAIHLLSSKETAPYFAKVVEEKLPQALLGQSASTAFSHDGVTGATLTSNAYIQAVNKAADPVRNLLYGYELVKVPSIWQRFKWLDITAVIFFIAAVGLSRSKTKYKAKLNSALLCLSTLLFGFYSASLYTVSTIGGFISATWITGVASYSPFILLALSMGYILYYNRNIYCQSLCPFGAVQQCLATIGNAKSSPVRYPFFIWFPRFLLLITLCMGAYFRNPASFVYEPFGIAFGMIGGIYLFVLTILILLTSLVVRRPWCQSLCPVNAMTDFIVFNKSWLKQTKRQLTNKQQSTNKRQNIRKTEGR